MTPGKIIITDNDQLRELVDVPNTFDFDGFKPTLNRVQRDHLLPLLGETLLNQLVTTAQSPPPSGDTLELLLRAQAALANLALAHYIPLLDIGITTAGLTVTRSDESAPASQARVEALKNQLLRDAGREFDELLRFLEAKAAVFTDWDGVEKANAAANFVNTTDQLADVVVFPIGRLVLNRMKPSISMVEERFIKPILRKEYFAALKTAIKNRDAAELTAKAELLTLIRKAVGHLAFAQAASQIGLVVDQSGIYYRFDVAGGQNIKGSKMVEDIPMATLIEHHNAEGGYCLEDLAAYLTANADDHPLYKAAIDAEATEETTTTPYQAQTGVHASL